MTLLQAVAGERIALPDDLDALTAIDRHAECDPRAARMTRSGVDRIWGAIEHLYRTGLHPSITLVLRRQGRIVMKRAIGCADPGAPAPAALDPDAPQCIFSASKVVTALLVHKLVEDGRLCLDDAIADTIPAFGRHGKAGITVRDLLAHRAGVPFIPAEYADTDLLNDWDRIIEILCERPAHFPNAATQAYHALTSGYIAGELVRRIADIELQTALREWIAQPLGCRYLTYGIDPALRGKRAHNAFTGPAPPWPLSLYFRRILGIPMREAVAAAGEDAFLSAVIPAGNIHASADDLGRVFEMLRCGGSLDGNRILAPETVRAVIEPAGRLRRDHTLHIPIRYSAGCMLGENPVGLYGPFCGRAYGHLGFMSILGWADPRRAISVALLNTGKSIAPAGLTRMARVLWAISAACKPIAD